MDKHHVESHKERPLPSVDFLEALHNTIARINNGRLAHERDTVRHSLLWYIRFIKEDMCMPAHVKDQIPVVIERAKKLIKATWG